MQNDDNFVYDDMNELIKQVNSNEDFLKVVPREKSEEEPTPEELQTMSLRDLFGYLSDKFALGINAFLDFLELSSEFSDELDERYKQKIAELEAMTHEEQEQFDVAEFWREQIDYVIQLKKQQKKEQIQKIKENTKNLDISKNEIKKFTFPIDVLNNQFWNNRKMKEETEGKRKNQLKINAAKSQDIKKGKNANIFVVLDFDKKSNISISEDITFYDERIYSAIGTLFDCGEHEQTLHQVFRQMGNRSNYGTREIEKLMNSIAKMDRAKVYIDNSQEHELYEDYELVSGVYSLLRVDFEKRVVNGNLTDVIIVKEMPKLYEIAKKKGHISTVKLEVIMTPLSKNDNNLELEKCLMTRIAREKNKLIKSKKKTDKIPFLLNTVFENCGIKDSKSKSRTIEKIERALSHYAKTEWIERFYFGDVDPEEEKKELKGKKKKETPAQKGKRNKLPDRFTVVIKK